MKRTLFLVIVSLLSIATIQNTQPKVTQKNNDPAALRTMIGLEKPRPIVLSDALNAPVIEAETKPVITWQDNPNGCDQSTQWIAAEKPFGCIDKPIATPIPVIVNRYITHTGGCEAFRNIIARYSWNVDVAVNVCSVESSGNVYASNWNDGHGSCVGSFGLFQIACIHQSQQASFDPEQNIAKAYQLYASSGWSPWSFRTCKIIACY